MSNHPPTDLGADAAVPSSDDGVLVPRASGDLGADVIFLPAGDITVDYCRRALAHAEREHWSLERLLTGPEYDYLFGFDGYRERSMEDLATVPPDDKASCVFDLQACAFSVLDYHDLLMALGGDRLAEGGAAGAVGAGSRTSGGSMP